MVNLYLACYRTTKDNLSGTKTTKQIGDPSRLFPLEEEMYVTKMMQFLKKTCCSDRKNRCLYCLHCYDKYRNLPRGFKCHFDAESREFWFTNSTRKMETATMYVDSAGDGNKKRMDELEKTVIQGGSIIYFRPDYCFRDDPNMVNMEFHVVGVPPNEENNFVSTPEKHQQIDPVIGLTESSFVLSPDHSLVLSPMGGAGSPILMTSLVSSPATESSKGLHFLAPLQTDNDIPKSEARISHEEEVLACAIPIRDSRRAPDPPSSPSMKRAEAADPPGTSPLFRSPRPEDVSLSETYILNAAVSTAKRVSIQKKKKEKSIKVD